MNGRARLAMPRGLSRRDLGRLSAALALAQSLPGLVRAGSRVIEVDDPHAIDWAGLGPGDEVILAAGRYDAPLVVPARGTPERPILIRAATPLAAVFTNSIVFEGAEHVVLADLLVEKAANSGVIIRRGSEAITVRGVTVRESGLGIWIGEGAGAGHRLTGNRVERNATHGIAIDQINASQGRETLIEGNLVRDNGRHGMEIDGSHYVVLRNRVDGNGRALSGCSGIHTFCRTPDLPFGKNNVIAFNTVSGTRETTGQDGNGIQADQWCDDNLIAFNVCFGNDGAGINLFDASRAGVFHNTTVGNMLDSGGSHAYRAEITLSSDYTRALERPTDNEILNNVAVSANPAAVPVYVEKTAGSRPHVIGNNLLHSDTNGPLGFWGPTGWRGADIAAWNAEKGGPPDLTGDPDLPVPGVASGAGRDAAEAFRPTRTLGTPSLAPLARLRQAALLPDGPGPGFLGALPPDGD